MLPITKGALDLGPWEQVFYAEFDGQRKKRVVVKVMGSDRPGAGAGGPAGAPSGREYPSRPIVGVGGVVFVDGRVLLIKRRFEPLAGRWSLQAGRSRWGRRWPRGSPGR